MISLWLKASPGSRSRCRSCWRIGGTCPGRLGSLVRSELKLCPDDPRKRAYTAFAVFLGIAHQYPETKPSRKQLAKEVHGMVLTLYVTEEEPKTEQTDDNEATTQRDGGPTLN
jgi:hypothetical protein